MGNQRKIVVVLAFFLFVCFCFFLFFFLHVLLLFVLTIWSIWNVWYLRSSIQTVVWFVTPTCWIWDWIFPCDQVVRCKWSKAHRLTAFQTNSGHFNHPLEQTALHKHQSFTHGSCLNSTAWTSTLEGLHTSFNVKASCVAKPTTWNSSSLPWILNCSSLQYTSPSVVHLLLFACFGYC